jgi:hypothetical protein
MSMPMPPPDTRAPGQAGHIADHNTISDGLDWLGDAVGSLQSQVESGFAGPNDPLPSDAGYVSWAYDPVSIQGGTAPASGTPQLAAVYLRQQAVVSDVVVAVTQPPAGGVTLTAGANFLGLYSPGGLLLAPTADITSLLSSGGVKAVPLASQQPLAPGWYWVACLLNWTGSGTQPQLARGSAVQAGSVLAANSVTGGSPSRRFATVTGGPYSSLPASFTTASQLAEAAAATWVAVS